MEATTTMVITRKANIFFPIATRVNGQFLPEASFEAANGVRKTRIVKGDSYFFSFVMVSGCLGAHSGPFECG